METKEQIFYMESKHKTELIPEKKIPNSEADFYKTSENDGCEYTQNTSTWD